jgi:hypothetical protein
LVPVIDGGPVVECRPQGRGQLQSLVEVEDRGRKFDLGIEIEIIFFTFLKKALPTPVVEGLGAVL